MTFLKIENEKQFREARREIKSLEELTFRLNLLYEIIEIINYIEGDPEEFFNEDEDAFTNIMNNTSPEVYEADQIEQISRNWNPSYLIEDGIREGEKDLFSLATRAKRENIESELSQLNNIDEGSSFEEIKRATFKRIEDINRINGIK